MFKLLVITSFIGSTGVAIAQTLVGFETEEEREIAEENIRSHSDVNIRIRAIKL